MRAFPLVRTSLSNEKIMGCLFAVLLLYQLPRWLGNPLDLLHFFIALAFGLFVDAIINFIRYKKPVCAVSAAVTVGILQILTPGIPLWGRLAGVAAALIAGKHIWGGTGKNIVNPAITGLFILSFFFKSVLPVFAPSVFLAAAVLLSIPFILFRPFAGTGYVLGMAVALLSGNNLNWFSVAADCAIFGCLIITDPVTSSPMRVFGFIGAFLAGFIPLYNNESTFYFTAAILAYNLVSYLLEDMIKPGVNSLKPRFKINAMFSPTQTDQPDKEEGEKQAVLPASELPADEILGRIEKNGVYGCGGAAFPTIKKINSLIASDAQEKYFIINAVECDPGLLHDKWLLRNFQEEICRGVKALGRCVSFKKVFLAVKETEGLNYNGEIDIIKVPKLYPIGAEKILAETVLGKKIPDGIVPSAAGILVLNVQTVLNIYQSVYFDRKADSKFITVSNLKNRESKVVKVKTGEKIHEIIKRTYKQKCLVFTGGGIMQSRMADDDAVVEQTTNFIAVADMPGYKESPLCSKCGFCTQVCPAGLAVKKIADMADKGDLSKVSKYNPDKCLSCGSCSYVCLAGRNLSARVKEAKEGLKVPLG